MIERVGIEALGEIEAYLGQYPHETVFARSDLLAWRRNGREQELPSLWGYRRGGRLVAAQALYASGRWLPHLADADALGALLDDALPRRPRWTVGVRRVMETLVDRVLARDRRLSYDERERLCYVDRSPSFRQPVSYVRRAEFGDVEAIAELRCLFEREYFGLHTNRVPAAWCVETARRYVSAGTYIAQRDGRIVAMAAVEADVPELTMIGAVYTREAYRGRGLAHAVVSAVCAEALRRRPRVALTVRPENTPARRVYDALGFRYWDEYRMCRFA